MGKWFPMKKQVERDASRVAAMRASAESMLSIVLGEAKRIPDDLRGLFLGLVWRGIRAETIRDDDVKTPHPSPHDLALTLYACEPPPIPDRSAEERCACGMGIARERARIVAHLHGLAGAAKHAGGEHDEAIGEVLDVLADELLNSMRSGTPIQPPNDAQREDA